MNSTEGLADHAVPGDITVLTMSAIMIAGMAINLTILVITLSYFMTLNKFERPSIVYLINLAIVNFIFILANIPLLVGLATANQHHDMEGEGVNCHFIGFILHWYSYITGFTITLLSIDRFLFFTKPEFYREHMKAWVAIAILVELWFMTGAISIPSYIAYEYSHNIRSCVFSEAESTKGVISIGFTMTLCSTVITAITSGLSTAHCLAKEKSMNRIPQSHENDPVYATRKKRVTTLIKMFCTVITTITGLSTCYFAEKRSMNYSYENDPTYVTMEKRVTTMMKLFWLLMITTGTYYALFLVTGILGGAGILDQTSAPPVAIIGSIFVTISTAVDILVLVCLIAELDYGIIDKVKKVFSCKRKSNAVAPQSEFDSIMTVTEVNEGIMTKLNEGIVQKVKKVFCSKRKSNVVAPQSEVHGIKIAWV